LKLINARVGADVEAAQKEEETGQIDGIAFERLEFK